ncbi:protein of unknown function [Kyrpidia spormannii]|uniref:Uncharacterized protein n=2 Tax=Kyrpidia spormannii TaxID=2055160 RepID=A0ACA8Z7S7_9BACL|nr:protein of unknown function [Kyrpidia spormannii]CAB3392109.1 protein of unknown function [Kyrpidia spormannii]
MKKVIVFVNGCMLYYERQARG